MDCSVLDDFASEDLSDKSILLRHQARSKDSDKDTMLGHLAYTLSLALLDFSLDNSHSCESNKSATHARVPKDSALRPTRSHDQRKKNAVGTMLALVSTLLFLCWISSQSGRCKFSPGKI